MRFVEAEIKRGHRGRRLTYEDAMGNDLVNAIIELVTNADDSYCSLEEQNKLHSQAQIRIEIERHQSEPTLLIVRDKAEGMSKQDMRKRIQWEGELHRDFKPGNRVRGMFGSGAKEVTHFGRTIFESIRDDKYTIYKLPKGGGSKYNKPEIASDSAENRRERLGIHKGNGTVVTIHVDSKQFTIPYYKTLKDRLRTTPQLQSIIQDRQRKIILQDINNPENTDRLFVVEPPSEVIIERRELQIPGFQDVIERINQPVILTLKRATEPLDENAGILIRAGRTIFERDQFGMTNQAHADLFFGDLECPFIWRLIAEAEARESNDRSLLPFGEDDEFMVENAFNPSRPVSRRRRSGLDRTHPFIHRLRSIVQPIVNSERQRSVSQLAKRNKPEIGEELQKELTEIASKLGEFLEGDRGDDEQRELRLIPSSLSIEKGETSSFYVVASNELVEAYGKTVEAIIINGEEFIEFEIPEGELKKREGHYSVGFGVKGNKVGNSQLLIALGNKDIVLNVNVSIKDDVEEAKLLSFDRHQYSVRADGARDTNIKILIHDNLKQKVQDDYLDLRLGGSPKISEAVKLVAPHPSIKENQKDGWISNSKLIGGRGGAGLTGQLTAIYGEEKASAHVKVTTDEEQIGDKLPFEIKYEPAIEARNRRYNWDLESDPEILWILTEHPSVQPSYKNSLSETNEIQLTQELKFVTREIAASAVAVRHIEDTDWHEGTRPEETLTEYEQNFVNALRHLYH